MSTLHYFVEVRHKYLGACINDMLNDKIWCSKLKDFPEEYLQPSELITYINDTAELVLNEISEGNQSMKSKSYIPNIHELFDKFRAANNDLFR